MLKINSKFFQKDQANVERWLLAAADRSQKTGIVNPILARINGVVAGLQAFVDAPAYLLLYGFDRVKKGNVGPGWKNIFLSSCQSFALGISLIFTNIAGFFAASIVYPSYLTLFSKEESKVFSNVIANNRELKEDVRDNIKLKENKEILAGKSIPSSVLKKTFKDFQRGIKYFINEKAIINEKNEDTIEISEILKNMQTWTSYNKLQNQIVELVQSGATDKSRDNEKIAESILSFLNGNFGVDIIKIIQKKYENFEVKQYGQHKFKLSVEGDKLCITTLWSVNISDIKRMSEKNYKGQFLSVLHKMEIPLNDFSNIPFIQIESEQKGMDRIQNEINNDKKVEYNYLDKIQKDGNEGMKKIRVFPNLIVESKTSKLYDNSEDLDKDLSKLFPELYPSFSTE